MHSADFFAEMLLRIQAVSIRLHPPYLWTSGIRSPLYTDIRMLISFPHERKQIITALSAIIQNTIAYDIGIAGTATAGIPWAAWLADASALPMVFVRPSQKKHGKENVIEGKVIEGKEYVVIEDVVSTGASAIHSINAIRNAGGKVLHSFAIFSYEFADAFNKFEENNCLLHSLVTFPVLIKKAIALNIITTAEQASIFSWKENPAQWQSN
jgi:orotate phosphoribosyltransferase